MENQSSLSRTVPLPTTAAKSDPYPVAESLSDGEIIWNRRFFRPNVWAHTLVGGEHFTPWNNDQSDPVDNLRRCRPFLLEHHGLPLRLIVGGNVIEAFRSHPRLRALCLLRGSEVMPPALEQIFELKLVSACLTFNAGWE